MGERCHGRRGSWRPCGILEALLAVMLLIYGSDCGGCDWSFTRMSETYTVLAAMVMTKKRKCHINIVALLIRGFEFKGLPSRVSAWLHTLQCCFGGHAIGGVVHHAMLLLFQSQRSSWGLPGFESLGFRLRLRRLRVFNMPGCGRRVLRGAVATQTEHNRANVGGRDPSCKDAEILSMLNNCPNEYL